MRGNYQGLSTTFFHEDTKKGEGVKYFSLFFLRVSEKLRAFVAFCGLKTSTLAVTVRGMNEDDSCAFLQNKSPCPDRTRASYLKIQTGARPRRLPMSLRRGFSGLGLCPYSCGTAPDSHRTSPVSTNAEKRRNLSVCDWLSFYQSFLWLSNDFVDEARHDPGCAAWAEWNGGNEGTAVLPFPLIGVILPSLDSHICGYSNISLFWLFRRSPDIRAFLLLTAGSYLRQGLLL